MREGGVVIFFGFADQMFLTPASIKQPYIHNREKFVALTNEAINFVVLHDILILMASC